MLGDRIAKKKANELLEYYGVEEAEHIRLRDMARDMGVKVEVGSLKDAAARLSILNGKAFIRIRDCDDENQIRFSIAHEFGHFQLHAEKIKSKTCQEIDFVNWSSDATLELEANIFSAELLLPSFLMKERCDVPRVNFKPVIDLANEFRTSLTSTTLRFVEMCPEPCAVVLSKAGKVSWFKKNDDFWPYVFAAGSSLNNRSLTYNVFAGGELHTNPEEVPAEAWTNSRIDSDAEVTEHVIPMPNYGVALTLLWLRT